jgi:hypothetical protein
MRANWTVVLEYDAEETGERLMIFSMIPTFMPDPAEPEKSPQGR